MLFNKIKSKYSLIQIFLLILLPAAICYKIIDPFNKRDKFVRDFKRYAKQHAYLSNVPITAEKPPYTFKDYALLFILGSGSVFFIYLFLRNAPSVTVDETGLDVRRLLQNGRSISKYEIEKVDLTGKHPWLFRQPEEDISVYLKEGTTIIIRDFYYRNMQEIREAFKEWNKNNSSQLVYESEKIELTGEFKKFSGNPYTSLNGLMFSGLLAGSLFSPAGWEKILLYLLIMGVFLFFLIGWHMHYFLLSASDLVVRNHFWFWLNKKYPLGEIRELGFESPSRSSNALRIITSNGSKLYGAGSLREKNWRNFKQYVEYLNIKLRNGLSI